MVQISLLKAQWTMSFLYTSFLPLVLIPLQCNAKKVYEIEIGKVLLFVPSTNNSMECGSASVYFSNAML